MDLPDENVEPKRGFSEPKATRSSASYACSVMCAWTATPCEWTWHPFRERGDNSRFTVSRQPCRWPNFSVVALLTQRQRAYWGPLFDKAWQTVQTSGSPLADEKHAAATREILAKNILAAGHRGDRDIHQLVEEALALLIILQRHISARHGRKRCGRIRRRASLLR